MNRVLTILIVLVFIAVPAYPVAFNFIDLPASAANIESASLVTSVSRTGTFHKYVQLDYPDHASNQCATWNFQLPDDYTTANAIDANLWHTCPLAGGSCNPGSFAYQFDLACLDDTGPFHAPSFSLGPPHFGSVQDVDQVGKIPVPALSIDTTGCDPRDQAILRLCRIGNDASPDALRVIAVTLWYEL